MKLMKKAGMASIMALTLILASGSVSASAVSLAEKVDPKQHTHHHHYKQHKCFSIHHDHYLKLLAEKYTPEDIEKWGAALQAKNELRDQFKALKNSDKNKDKPRRTLFSKEEKKAHLALHQQFVEAVKSENDKQIKMLLPKLLAEQEQFNAKMQDKLIEWKKNMK